MSHHPQNPKCGPHTLVFSANAGFERKGYKSEPFSVTHICDLRTSGKRKMGTSI